MKGRSVGVTGLVVAMGLGYRPVATVLDGPAKMGLW
mgnify:CR=1 FL=1|jgi:hypothetical protein